MQDIVPTSDRSAGDLPRPGQVLDNKYRVEALVGKGGMGVVMSAMHEGLGRRVALKFMRDDVKISAQWAARFEREARAATLLTCEYVARVFDVASLPCGTRYIVMEYLQGKTISEKLEREGRFEIEAAVDYLLQACEAVGEAHAAGIIHRDLKPSNLFCTTRPDGRDLIKVLDFGVSKFVEAEATPQGALTTTSQALGSPLYMSPEQMKSPRDVDARSDVWALGVILYEMLTGQPPFLGQCLPSVCANILGGRFRPIQELRPDVPSDLARAIHLCLLVDPTQRMSSVANLAGSVEPFGSSESAGVASRIARVLGEPETRLVAVGSQVCGASNSVRPRSYRPMNGVAEIGMEEPPNSEVRQRGWRRRTGLVTALSMGLVVAVSAIGIALTSHTIKRADVQERKGDTEAPARMVALALGEQRGRMLALSAASSSSGTVVGAEPASSSSTQNSLEDSAQSPAPMNSSTSRRGSIAQAPARPLAPKRRPPLHL